MLDEIQTREGQDKKYGPKIATVKTIPIVADSVSELLHAGNTMNHNSETYVDRMFANATKFTGLLLSKGLLFRTESEFSEEKQKFYN